ncbi:hypothetical protein [Streptomyces sp. NPDC056387]|uniref:hypothetical protein n=1 Tax=Streptomyces sp. NPDC056387 TaxID=3345803 RepID=UPI0035D80E59
MTEELQANAQQAGPAVSVVRPGDGETIVLGTTRMRVLEDGSHTGHRLTIAESVLAPHTQGPPLQEALAGGRPLTPQANIDAMSRYATEPATGLG